MGKGLGTYLEPIVFPPKLRQGSFLSLTLTLGRGIGSKLIAGEIKAG